ncbi:hypothetical protein SLE2022_138820 [Rubroshorea leprosula]
MLRLFKSVVGLVANEYFLLFIDLHTGILFLLLASGYFVQVQNDHFEESFSPELDKHGYQALYKRKTNEVYSRNPLTIDGCATFFRRDRFSHVKKYEVEFNKAAQSLTDFAIPSTQKKAALNRLVKIMLH